jgi:hypothetical protein
MRIGHAQFLAFLLSTLTEGAEYWINDKKHKLQFQMLVASMIVGPWRPKLLQRLLDIVDLNPSLHRPTTHHFYWLPTCHNGLQHTPSRVVDVVRFVLDKPQYAGLLCGAMYCMLVRHVMYTPHILQYMNHAGLPLAQLSCRIGDHIVASHFEFLHEWKNLIRGDLAFYVSNHQRLPCALDELQTQRRFRTSRVGTLWQSKDLLLLVCAYVMDCSEQETDAVEECAALLNE